jgi:AcrR family transcriptional regulator
MPMAQRSGDSRPVKPSRRTQRERRARTERRLIDATIGLIARDGVRAASVAAVGQAAGYSRGIVTHQFGSRRGLMDAVARDLQARLPLRSASTRGLDRVLDQVGMYLDAIAEGRPDTKVFMMLWAESIVADPDLRPTFVARDQQFRDAIAASLRAGVRDGTVAPDVQPRAMAVAIVGQLRGVVLQLLLAPDAAPLPRLRKQILRSLRVGLAAQQSSG